jgi:hypothetical protein
MVQLKSAFDNQQSAGFNQANNNQSQSQPAAKGFFQIPPALLQ